MKTYRRLQRVQAHTAWRDVLGWVREFRARLRARRGGRPLPLPEEVIREMREERDAELTGLR